ncbi:MAG TPA: tetratricopeptide repeat protein [Planctomycetota bacterium]|nr:tetratricopeptide repeat protein [Planctomycetota bacterium]
MASVLTPRQTRLLRFLLALAVFVLANSLYLFTAGGGSGYEGVAEPRAADLPVFYQLMLLSHLVVGFALLAVATVFVVWHLGRVRRLLKWPAVSSGGGLTLAAYLLFASGLFIFYQSNSREHRWIFHSHQALALLAPLLYGVHRLVSHYRPARAAVVRPLVALAGLYAVMLGVHFVTRPPEPPPIAVAERPKDPFIPFAPVNYPSEQSPFFPSRTTTDSGRFFPARIVTKGELGDFDALKADVEKYGFNASTPIGAETCNRCHPDIVKQWSRSAHRFASFNNPFYRAGVEKFRKDAGKKTSQWCAGCHDPAIMLAGNMTNDIQPLIPESQAGLTCLACHAIDRIHGIEGNGGYHIADEKPSPYLGDAASSGPLRFLADQMIKAKPAAHKALMKKPFFATAQYCAACHKVSLDVPVNKWRYFRGQDEYDAWDDSGVPQNAARTFYLPKESKSCRDCHMPLEDAPLGDVSAKSGKVRSHRFLAVNTAVPFVRGDTETIRRTEEFLRDGKLSVDVFALQRADGTMVRAIDRAKPSLAPGEEVVFEVVVRNKGVGHTFPGGTNDSNEGWIEFRVTDQDGRELFESGAIGDDGHLDPRAHAYKVTMLRHDGSEATQRDPQNFHVAAFARVIGPGTADVARYAFRVPEGVTRVNVEAKLQWRKFNRKYTEFVFGEAGMKVPDLPGMKRPVPDLPVSTIAESAVGLEVGGRGGAEPVGDPALWMRYNDHGIANFLQGALDVAEASWKEVSRLRPDLPDGYRNQARRWLQSAQPEKARAFLVKVDEVAPRDPQRPYFWGVFYEKTEEFEQAEKAYEASLAVFPGDRDGWRHLGAVRYKLHKYEASLDAYLRALAIDPEDVESHKRRLDIYNQLGREREAAEARKAFEKYKLDEEANEVARRFLLANENVNEEAQPRHVHR